MANSKEDNDFVTIHESPERYLEMYHGDNLMSDFRVTSGAPSASKDSVAAMLIAFRGVQEENKQLKHLLEVSRRQQQGVGSASMASVATLRQRPAAAATKDLEAGEPLSANSDFTLGQRLGETSSTVRLVAAEFEQARWQWSMREKEYQRVTDELHGECDRLRGDVERIRLTQEQIEREAKATVTRLHDELREQRLANERLKKAAELTATVDLQQPYYLDSGLPQPSSLHTAPASSACQSDFAVDDIRNILNKIHRSRHDVDKLKKLVHFQTDIIQKFKAEADSRHNKVGEMRQRAAAETSGSRALPSRLATDIVADSRVFTIQSDENEVQPPKVDRKRELPFVSPANFAGMTLTKLSSSPSRSALPPPSGQPAAIVVPADMAKLQRLSTLPTRLAARPAGDEPRQSWDKASHPSSSGRQQHVPAPAVFLPQQQLGAPHHANPHKWPVSATSTPSSLLPTDRLHDPCTSSSSYTYGQQVSSCGSSRQATEQSDEPATLLHKSYSLAGDPAKTSPIGSNRAAAVASSFDSYASGQRTAPEGSASISLRTSTACEYKTCPVCNARFSGPDPLEKLQEHILDCEGTQQQHLPTQRQSPQLPDASARSAGSDVRTCPMCSAHFPPELPHSEFELHVMSHFDEDYNIVDGREQLPSSVA